MKIRKEKRKEREKKEEIVIRVMKIVKEERKNDQTYKFWHGYDGLVLREDTNIRPGYIGHQHLNDGLMQDVQICSDEGVHGKKIKVVKVVVEMTGFRILELAVHGKNRVFLEAVGKQLEEDTFDEMLRVKTKGSLYET
ncbi:hypothetical protein ACLOJK_004189 [Asimina triloba]